MSDLINQVPQDVEVWAAQASADSVTPPSSEQIARGWEANAGAPPRQWFNWFWKMVTGKTNEELAAMRTIAQRVEQIEAQQIPLLVDVDLNDAPLNRIIVVDKHVSAVAPLHFPPAATGGACRWIVLTIACAPPAHDRVTQIAISNYSATMHEIWMRLRIDNVWQAWNVISGMGARGFWDSVGEDMNLAPACDKALYYGLNNGSNNWPPVHINNGLNMTWLVTTDVNFDKGRGRQRAEGIDIWFGTGNQVWTRMMFDGEWRPWVRIDAAAQGRISQGSYKKMGWFDPSKAQQDPDGTTAGGGNPFVQDLTVSDVGSIYVCDYSISAGCAFRLPRSSDLVNGDTLTFIAYQPVKIRWTHRDRRRNSFSLPGNQCCQFVRS